MAERKRRRNEAKFSQWEELESGGRRYWHDVISSTRWRARYIKEVDAEEKTTRFAQEIYDSNGTLIEVHEKYPVDLGHRKVE